MTIILIFIISAERNASTVVMQNVQHIPNNEPIYVTRGKTEPYTKRKYSVSVVDLQEPPLSNEFRRPKRTARSVSPSNSFRYILPFHSQREQEKTNLEETSLGNRQNVPMTVKNSPMYVSDYL